MFFRDGAGLSQVCLEVIVGVSDVHGGTAQNVRRSHQARVANIITKLLRRLPEENIKKLNKNRRHLKARIQSNRNELNKRERQSRAEEMLP